jgi:tRNA (cmo5U34)-methyltransferase
MHVLYDTAANSPAGAVLDANWQPDIDGTRLMELALPLVQVFCDLPPQLAQRRLLARVESGQRHPVHRDAIDPDVLRRMVQQAAEPAQPLPVPVPVVHVDASTDVDIDLVVAQLRKHMAFAPQPGGWHNAAQVNAYLDRVDRLPRVAGEELLVDLLPAQPERILDLGCGDGRLAALVLRARPSIREALATDISTPMLERARERFAGDPRVQVLRRDLHRPLDDLGAFDVVVSGCAIHHVDDDRKRTLFSEIARNVRPGGLFANLEVVQSATPAMHAAFLAAVGRDADDPEDRLAPVDAQLTWMREAGLQHVDCLWRWRGLALLVGQSPPHT